MEWILCKTQKKDSPPGMSDEISRKMTFYFWTILLGHAFLWSFLPPFFMSSFLCDSWEMMVIGQNGVLSTYKHPAFQGWLAEIVRQILQSPRWVPYVCSQLAVILSIYGIWRLSRKYLSPPLALLAALSMLSYIYFHYESPLYNNRTFLRVFWIYAVLFLWDALESNQIRYWILTGICLALGIYCKLTMFLLVMAIVCFMIVDRKARQYWKTPGPYCSTGICFLLFLPLLVYLFQTNFSLIAYANDRTMFLSDKSFFCHFWSPLKFLLSQLPILLLIVIPLLPVLGFHWQFRWEVLRERWEGRFLAFFVGFPIFFQVAMILLSGGTCRTALGCHLWLFSTLILLYTCKTHLTQASWKRSIRLIVFLVFFYFGLWGAMITVRPVYRQEKLAREYLQADELAGRVETIWQERYSVPLEYVRGDDWLAASASIWGKSRPRVYSPLWATEEDFLEKGGILLWLEESCASRIGCFDCYHNPDFFYSPETNRPDEWLKKFPSAEILPMLEIPQKTCFKAAPVKIYMAIVPPKKERNLSQGW